LFCNAKKLFNHKSVNIADFTARELFGASDGQRKLARRPGKAS
jgi:hypothetical protein